MKIIKAGIQDTIQDSGRYGNQHLGINPTGAIPQDQMVITGSNDGVWVNVTDSKDNNKGIIFVNTLSFYEIKYLHP